MTDTRSILEAAGYPTDTLVLDAESYFDADYSLRKLTTYEYVLDPRFELLGWAWKWNDEPAIFGGELPEIDWDNTTIIVHNAMFDCLVLKHLYGVLPPFVVDTLDLARHIEPRWRNKLEVLAERHGLPAKGDTMQFKGLHLSDLCNDPVLWEAMKGYAANDAELEYSLFQILLPKLTIPTFELGVMKYTRELFTNPVLRFDAERAANLKHKMLDQVDMLLIGVGHTKKDISGNKSFEGLLRDALDPECPPYKQGKKGQILAIAKKDPGYEYLLNHPTALVRKLIEARSGIKSWPLHVKRVASMERVATLTGGLMPVPLKYCGAHTGRWSGTEKINLHNLPAHGHELINAIRGMLIAPDGRILLILDFAQIEARVLVWLADQFDMVRKFATGVEVYCEFATELVGKKIRKPRKTDLTVVREWYGNFRSLGKVGVLGCGYGMGADRCQDYAKNTYGVGMDHAMAERVIDLYRRQNPMVVLFWKKVEQAFTLAITCDPNRYSLDHDLVFFREGNEVNIQLPNGRRLRYTGARTSGSGRYRQLVMPDPLKGTKIHMWGGYLTENIVQAVSRDILAEAVMNIKHELGLRVPLTVHDDMSIVIPEGRDDLVEAVLEIVRRVPMWAPGLPVDVEYKLSERYMKI